ncbi:MAG: hypothetical protein AAGF81_15550, partial [Pseudomonadota bacterium]
AALRNATATHEQSACLDVDQLPGPDDTLGQFPLKSGDCPRDGLIWPTEGRVFASAERRCGPLVVGQTKARPAPRQQTREPGQAFPYDKELL